MDIHPESNAGEVPQSTAPASYLETWTTWSRVPTVIRELNDSLGHSGSVWIFTSDYPSLRRKSIRDAFGNKNLKVIFADPRSHTQLPLPDDEPHTTLMLRVAPQTASTDVLLFDFGTGHLLGLFRVRVSTRLRGPQRNP
jgi:hypothetical protein